MSDKATIRRLQRENAKLRQERDLSQRLFGEASDKVREYEAWFEQLGKLLKLDTFVREPEND